MGNIVIVMPRIEDANRIGDIIRKSDIWEEVICCTSGNETIRLVRNQDVSVVIGTKKYSDMGYEEMVSYLPPNVKMMLLTKDSSLVPFSEAVVKVLMPFSGADFLSTLRMMLPEVVVKKRKPPKRSTEDQKIIDDAKRLLMERNGMTEPEAFRFIQKASMDTRRTMVESAQMILSTNGG